MEYTSVLRGFENIIFPSNYGGPPGAFAGSAAGFQAAALFLMNDVDADGPVPQTLWGNQDAVAGSGWSLAVRKSTVVGIPPNAIDVIARVAGSTRVATLLSAYPGVPILAHMAAVVVPDAVSAVLYINGVLAASGLSGGTIVPSTAGPIVGSLSNGVGVIEPCTQAQILGVMYHESLQVAPGVTPASFYIACRQAETLVGGLDNAASSFQNQYTVQRGLTGRGITPAGVNGPMPPTIWSPDVGLVPLTRAAGSSLTVRGYKNLDWHASLFTLFTQGDN